MDHTDIVCHHSARRWTRMQFRRPSSKCAADDPSARIRSAPHSHTTMITTSRLTFATLSVVALAACVPSPEHKRADSTAAVAATAAIDSQSHLATQLAAQKDSLTRIVLQADDFIMQVDKSMSRVRGLPKGKKKNDNLDPLARQVENRKLVMERVDALVARAQATAAQLAKRFALCPHPESRAARPSSIPRQELPWTGPARDEPYRSCTSRRPRGRRARVLAHDELVSAWARCVRVQWHIRTIRHNARAKS